MDNTQISHQDVEALASKLAGFTQSLSPGERAAFEMLEAQLAEYALGDDEDVQGYTFNPQLLDIAAQRQNEYRAAAAAERQRRSVQAADGGDTATQRAGFWRTVLGSLATQHGLRPATDATGAS